MAAYIAYYRVSTIKQGQSGLGLAAQQSSVSSYTRNVPLRAEFVEIESGKRATNRPQLAAALAMCKKEKAILVIAKLDRLARNVHFISGLMEAGVDFIACDMPAANKLTIHVLAAMAEHEREMISQRTKAALAEARRRGVVLGNPRMAAMRELSRRSHQGERPAPEIVRLMLEWQAQGLTLRSIAAKLNGLNLRTSRGKDWYAATVRIALLHQAAV